MAIIEYDKSPNATIDQKLRSLAASVMRTIEEEEGAISKEVIDEICALLESGDESILPITSKTKLGCMIVGDGLNVRKDGTVWSDGTTMSPMTNTEIDEICK